MGVGIDFRTLYFDEFWFVFCAFLCSLAYWLVKKVFKINTLAILITCLIAIVMPLGSMYRFNFLLPFFFMGGV